MMIEKQSFTLDLSASNCNAVKLNTARVTIPAQIVHKIYKQVLQCQKSQINSYGFQKGEIPIEYIEKNFKFKIIDHLKEFLFRYFVVSFLYQNFRNNKIITAGEPRFIQASVEPDKDAEFVFEYTPVEQINNIDDWRYLVFRASKRKNYKDLDKQATSFIKEEQSKRKENEENKISVNDWVCFNISIVDAQKKPLIETHKENLWLKIGDDEPSIPFQEIFFDKFIGDTFYTNSQCLQQYFDSQTNGNYDFYIEIVDVNSSNFFSINYLKEHFKLKSNKAIHQKLIEVFSFRNDLSLRKVIVEELFDLLFYKFPFDAPRPAILRQQKEILDVLQLNPDYPVYRMQKDFDDRVESLAKRQVKETILMDTLAYLENICVQPEEIKYYLNLSNRPRTKEFIYFQHPIIKANEQEYPLPTELLKQDCLREKTLNYTISYLTRD